MDDEEEPTEESRPVRGGQSRVPTLKERQEHERTHLPYWRHCVAARASNPVHRGRKISNCNRRGQGHETSEL